MARVLVVEDNATNLYLMVYLLKAFGHVPLTASDGMAGLEIAQREDPDIALIDIHMPEMDGYTVVRRLRAAPSGRRIPLIAVTALAMVGDRERVLAGGFDGYIAKPIDPETFVAEMEAFLEPTKTLIPPTPIANVPAAPAVARVTTERIRSGFILVVDDTAANLALFRTILESAGFEIASAASVSEAVAAARARKPDLILSDLHLGDESGLDLLRIAKQDRDLREIPFAIVSASAPGGNWERKCRALGAQEVISWPVEPETLLVAIGKQLES